MFCHSSLIVPEHAKTYEPPACASAVSWLSSEQSVIGVGAAARAAVAMLKAAIAHASAVASAQA